MNQANPYRNITILAAIFYSCAFIWCASYSIYGVRYFMLTDDAMISMRYAWNLWHGNGFVWNSGDYIEGISNPLWALYMALWQWLPVNLASLPVQLTGALIYVSTIATLHRKEGTFPAFVLLCYAPFAYWSIMMETGAVAYLLLLSVLLIEKGKEKQGYFILAIAVLIRMDLALMIPAIACYRRKHLGYSVLAFILPIVLLTTFRLVYYGEWLPNTYYVKMTGIDPLLRITRGTYYLLKNHSVLIFIGITGVAITHRWFIAYVIGIQMVYNCWIGGDVWDFWQGGNRFIVTIVPLVALLGGCAFNKIALKWRQGMRIAAIAFLIFALQSTLIAQLFFIEKPFYVPENRQKTQLGIALRRMKPASIAVTWAGIIMYLNPDSKGVDILGKCDAFIAHLPMHIVDSGAKKYIRFNPGHMKWDYHHSIAEQKPEIITSLWNSPQTADTHDYVNMIVSGQQIWVHKSIAQSRRYALKKGTE